MPTTGGIATTRDQYRLEAELQHEMVVDQGDGMTTSATESSRVLVYGSGA